MEKVKKNNEKNRKWKNNNYKGGTREYLNYVFKIFELGFNLIINYSIDLSKNI